MGKTRIENYFQDKLAANEKLFIPYIMAGDGGLNRLEERIAFLEDCGASAIELGIPFSDPVADGPTIQQAGLRALNNGITLRAVLEKLSNFREKYSIPIILMTYINLIYSYGIERFAQHCYSCGIDGIIIPDLPMEEEGMITKRLREFDIAFIRLVAITSPKTRMREISSRTDGFLYAVSVMGTTGEKNSYADNVIEYLTTLKKISSVPVLAGFGVSGAKQARHLSQYCDGVIVGSKIVDLLHKERLDEVRKLVEGGITIKESL